MGRKTVVYLRAFERSDAKLINSWRRDREDQVMNSGLMRYVSSAMDEKWIEDIVFNSSNRLYWAICLTSTDEMVGYVGCRDIDWVNRSAVGYALYLDKAHRAVKYSLEACYQVYEYVFDQMGLNRYEVDVLEENEAVCRLHAAMGLKEEGIKRQAVFKNGRFQNVVVMALLNEDFQNVKASWCDLDTGCANE